MSDALDDIRKRATRWAAEPRAVRGGRQPSWHSSSEKINDLLQLSHDALMLLSEVERLRLECFERGLKIAERMPNPFTEQHAD